MQSLYSLIRVIAHASELVNLALALLHVLCGQIAECCLSNILYFKWEPTHVIRTISSQYSEVHIQLALQANMRV